MIIRKSWWRLIAVYIILFAFMYWPLIIYADVGDGSGGGGGPAVPLYMDWSYPRDGETNISVNPIIQCKFSHNVAHFEVQKRNKTLFSLRKEDGTDVPIRAYTVDAQIEFDKRQYIYLSPINSLEENTTYFVSVNEGVQAKNGMATEKGQEFCFVTGSKNYSVPLLIDNKEKGSTEGQVLEFVQSIENSNDSLQSEDFTDYKQIESEVKAQQSDVSQMSAPTEEEVHKEADIKQQTQTQSIQGSAEKETEEQIEITSRITLILVAVIIALTFICSSVVRIKLGSSPKLPCLTFTEIKEHYGKQ